MRYFVISGTTALAAWLAVGSTGVDAAPLGTAFTYQGRLDSGGSPVSGTADFQFTLWSAVSGPSQVAGPIAVNNVTVSGGLFTATVDFGSAELNGHARWLEVAARSPAGGGSFITLTPRQPLTISPFAGLALDALTAGDCVTLGGLDSDAFLQAVPNPLVLSGSTATGPIIKGSNTGTGAAVMAIQGEITSTSATGSSYGGFFTNVDDLGIGVLGRAQGVTGKAVYGQATSATGVNYGGYFTTSSASGYAGYFTGGKNYFEGNVGIGVSNPIAKLDVTDDSGNALSVVHTGDSGHVAQFYVGASEAASGLYSVTYGGGYAGSFEAHNTNSTATLNCYKNGGPALRCTSTHTPAGTAATDCVVAVVGGSDSEPNGGGFLVMGSVVGLNVSIDNNEIMARSGGATAALALNADGGNVNLIQGGTGNVGIGTSNPLSKLHVNGTARCDVLEIVGADLAEKFPVSDETKPGMVVMIDAENPGKLCLARGAYNKGVAGVVSGANGLPAGTVLGHLPGSEQSPPIALSGRVWVYCDASERAVEVTDLLTTSETPGHAMAALDATRSHGAVIGKAMTGLAKGEQGLVLVLVNLQ